MNKKYIIFLFILAVLFYPNIKSANITTSITGGSFNSSKYLIINILSPDKSKIYFKSKDNTPSFKINIKELNKDYYDIIWPKPILEEGHLYYDNNVEIPIELKNTNNLTNISVEYSFIVCSDICYLINKEDIVDLNIINFNQSNNIIQNAFNRDIILKNNPNFHIDKFYKKNDQIILEIFSQQELVSPILIIEDDRNSFLTKPKISSKNNNYKLIYDIYDNLKNGLFDIFLIDNNIAWEGKMILETNNWYYIFIAYLGGFIINFMPCVLPVLSIKLISIINTSNKDKKIIRKNILQTISGIIFTFFLIALFTVFFRLGGEALGLGLYLQNIYFITFICIILVLFIIMLEDNLNISIPSFVLDKIETLKLEKFGLNSNFFEGILATLLGIPCSAPLIGVAMSFAFTQDAIWIFAIFFSISIGFSSPYILIATYPKILNILPKPGKWMLILKKILSILLILSLIWFLFIFSKQTSYISASLLALICLLLKFLIEQKSSKYFIILLIITSFILPLQVSKKFNSFNKVTNQVWQELDIQKIPILVKEGKIVIVDVTADWCAICQFNKIRTLKNPNILRVLYQPNVIAMRGDLTNKNDYILRYINQNKRYGIPFNIIYGPNKPEGILLPELVSENDIIEAVKLVR